MSSFQTTSTSPERRVSIRAAPDGSSGGVLTEVLADAGVADKHVEYLYA
ncbi:hypothetical protein [Deinococcus psychrotolerans]|nr:hypothetical protein [Deinococcus psychrotolerans]